MVNLKIENFKLINLFISISIIIISVIVLNISISIIAYLKISEYFEYLSLNLAIILSFIIIPTYLSSIFNYKTNPLKLLSKKKFTFIFYSLINFISIC